MYTYIYIYIYIYKACPPFPLRDRPREGSCAGSPENGIPPRAREHHEDLREARHGLAAGASCLWLEILGMRIQRTGKFFKT